MNDVDLRTLAAIDRLAGPSGDNGYPTAREIAERLGAGIPDIATRMRRLYAAGLVEPVGVAFSGARTWALTAVGRQATEIGCAR